MLAAGDPLQPIGNNPLDALQARQILGSRSDMQNCAIRLHLAPTEWKSDLPTSSGIDGGIVDKGHAEPLDKLIGTLSFKPRI